MKRKPEKIEYYKGDYKYALKDRVEYETGIVGRGCILPLCSLTTEGLLTIEPGYAWDAPPRPTFDTPSFMRGSLVHDVLYQMLRQPGFVEDADEHEILRHRADLLLREICLIDGMWEWRANWVLRGVRAGGGPSAAIKERQVYSAP